jgi:replicative DNA helicase
LSLDEIKDLATRIFTGGFQSSVERLNFEAADRAKRADGVLKFGIRFLDDATGGIEKSDLIVIGAPSGVGKTELMVHIALTAARTGKRAHYFALEAEDLEIERRVKYKHMAKLYWSDPKRPHLPALKYRYWKQNTHAFELDYYDAEATANTKADMANMFTYYKDESAEEFTVDAFVSKMQKIRGETDIIFIDHLNYFDRGEKNDPNETFKIMKTIRQTALKLNIPVILASQVRKQDRKDPKPVPDMEDIYGSSDVYKVATKVIMFAPNLDYQSPDNRTFETFMRVQKMRLDNSVGRVIGTVSFDASKNTYGQKYSLVKANNFKGTVDELPKRLWPEWASDFDVAPTYDRDF